MNFTDTVTVAATRRTADGYLVADARIARTGIQHYRGAEIGRPDADMVRVYRPGAEVFSEDTLRSAAHRPVTNGHPPEMVSSENWKRHAVGQTGDEVAGEGIFLRVPLMVSDEATVRDIEDGKRALSAGYVCDLDFTAGVTPGGEAYDAMQRNIRINHIAIVRHGRAGPQVRIGDTAAPWGCAPLAAPCSMPDPQTRQEKTMTSVETAVGRGAGADTGEQAAETIASLRRQLTDAQARIADAEKAAAARDAEFETARPGLVDDAEIARRAEARADLIVAARRIAPDVKIAGLPDADIRKATVAARIGDAALAGRSQAYVDARFDLLAESVGERSDAFAAVVKDGLTHSGAQAAVSDAYAAMVRDLQSAHLPVERA